ncbi:MAG: multifunctional CCA addition/repair protein [Halieaceae bacterium]|jgi:tRNA nucleotidyltransferase (CCA-adding enzyme)|nr:multifunctional CCA addition/repair protein [Halieaceae bacterium]
MNTYLVGGAVRDSLLGFPYTERDWVVVGATPQHMLDAGYTQVGRDFPVFLHPETKEEYALARTERKQGHGYTGFVVHTDPGISIEDDLRRRDLTINAIARDDDGRLVDPYNGRDDLEDRVLRHVSPAFTEDPLRVLRVARFAARYATLDFRIAEETLALMRTIVDQGELAHLPAERVWTEIERALREASPQVFIEVLRDCGALRALLPEVDALFGVPQKAEHHPEIDTGRHTLMVLEQAARLTWSLDGSPAAYPSRDPRSKAADENAGTPAAQSSERAQANSRVVFAALTHDLGKGITPEDILPSHRGHEGAGLPLVNAVCDRLKAPNAHRHLALAVCEHHLNSHRALELRPATVLKLLESIGALRDHTRFEEFLLSCEADSRGRLGFEGRPYPQADYLLKAAEAAQSVTAADVKAPGVEGKAIGEAIRQERIRRIGLLRGS